MDAVSTMPVNEATSVADPHGERFLRFAATGDAAVLDQLLMEHLDRSHAQARRLMGNASEAEDIVQDAFLRLVATADRYDGSIPFAAWLGCLVHNAAISALRKRAVRTRRERRSDISDLGRRPEASADDNSQEVCAAVKELPEAYRSVVDLHYFAGLSQGETAKALGVKENAVAKRLQRARESLRELLNKRGVMVSAGVIAAALVSQPAYAASEALRKSCTSAALASRAGTEVSRGLLAVTTSGQKWALAAKILAIATAAASIAIGVAVGSSAHAPASAKEWTFDDGVMDGLEPRGDAFRMSAHGGIADSGCLVTGDKQGAIVFDFSTDQVPLEITFKAHAAYDGAAGLMNHVTWFDLDTYAFFDDSINPRQRTDGQDWIPYRVVVTERSIESWIFGQRTHLAYVLPAVGARLGLLTFDRCLIDDLAIKRISRDEIPHDADRYLDAAQAISADRRTGVVSLPISAKPGGDPLKLVFQVSPVR